MGGRGGGMFVRPKRGMVLEWMGMIGLAVLISAILVGLVVVVEVLSGGKPISDNITSSVSSQPYKVEVNLGRVNSDLAAGPHSWDFKVNGKKVSPGPLWVWGKFEIEVVEVDSQKTADRLDIKSLISEGDLITYAYYPQAPGQKEALFIICVKNFKSSNESVRMIPVNIH